MKRIGLLSDTHGYLDPALQGYFESCDEIWHAGDVGSEEVLDTLETWGPEIRVVFGNIDDAVIQRRTHQDLIWHCADAKILMTHIAGYPGRYNKHAQDLIRTHRPDVVICGHSHILKVVYDADLNHLHINPGACGRHGLHLMRTAIRFEIDSKQPRNMEVIELGLRGSLSN